MLKFLLYMIIVALFVTGCSAQIWGSQEEDTKNPVSSGTTVNMTNENGQTVSKSVPMSTESGKMTKLSEQLICLQTASGEEIVFRLNGSKAATAFYKQLPAEVEISDYSDNEKIFYPSIKLDVTSTQKANPEDSSVQTNGKSEGVGTLAYYEPWGDVVIFYGPFTANDGLYELGQVVQGQNVLKNLKGTVKIEVVK